MHTNITQLAFDALAILNATHDDAFAPTNAVRALPQFDALSPCDRERVNRKVAHLIDNEAKRGAPLSFAEFQATRIESTDLASDTGNDCFDEPARGFVYMGDAFVEYIGGGEYMLTIGNDSRVSADLWDLERRVYLWWCSENERTAQAVFVDDSAPVVVGLIDEQQRRRTAILDRVDAAKRELEAAAVVEFGRRFAAAGDTGPQVHAAMANGASADYFDENTGGWVWVSHALHEYRQGPARVRVLAMTGCDGVSVYRVPDDCATLQQFAAFVYDLCGEDAPYLVGRAGD